MGALFLSSCANSFQEASQESEAIHLRRKSVVEYYLNREATNLTETAVRETFARWSTSTHFSFVYGGRNGAGLRRDGKNTVSFLIKWPAEIPMGKIAYCCNWYDRKGNIVESDIILNMAIARFTTLHTNKPDSYYIEGVLSHEIGHMIGLEHSEDDGSLMKHLSSAKESFFKGKIDSGTLSAYSELYAGQV